MTAQKNRVQFLDLKSEAELADNSDAKSEQFNAVARGREGAGAPP